MNPNDPIRQFRKKPVVIEAVQWTGENLDAVMAFCAGDATYELMAKGNSELVIATLEDGEAEAKHVASRNDWIIKGVQGEFYPCKPDIFDATYEPAALPAVTDPQIATLQATNARLVDALRVEKNYWTGKAEDDMRLFDTFDAMSERPQFRAMTEAMKRADNLSALLAELEKAA